MYSAFTFSKGPLGKWCVFVLERVRGKKEREREEGERRGGREVRERRERVRDERE
jgi:hypothetical protein